jgi:hypothetical protein
MTLDAYAALITREVRERLPGVRAARRGSTVTWTLGKAAARLDAARADRWELVVAAGEQIGCRTYCDCSDPRGAHVAANNIVVHFDPRWCRGIDVEPYSEADMKRLGEKRSFVS